MGGSAITTLDQIDQARRERATRGLLLREAAIIAPGLWATRLPSESRWRKSGLIAFLIDAAEIERKAYLTFLAKMLPQVHIGADVHKKIGADVHKKDNYCT